MNKTFHFTSAMPFDDSFDVMVIGGGISGALAAAAAGREGAKTLLVERTGALGGMATSGLVLYWNGLSDGQHFIQSGLARYIVDKGRALMPDRRSVDIETCAGGSIDPELTKSLLDGLIETHNVKMLLLTSFCTAKLGDNGNIQAVITANKAGLQAYGAKVYIDATGDADVVAAAGAPYEKEAQMQPTTLCFAISGVSSYHYLFEPHMAAHNVGRLICTSDKYPNVKSVNLTNNLVGKDTVAFNAGHTWGIDGTDPADVTGALVTGRKIAGDIHRALCELRPNGFAGACLMTTANLPGIRETRRIVGDYVLSMDDYLNRRSFPDEIARNSNPIDIHPPTQKVSEEEFHTNNINRTNSYPACGRGESYGIPYRCLIPRELNNVLVAGRPISVARDIYGSTRVMGPCMSIGEAAGIAAAMAAEAGISPREVDAAVLRGKLREYGAYLP